MTRKYETDHWQMRKQGVNGKVSVIFEDCGDVQVVHCKGPWGFALQWCCDFIYKWKVKKLC